MYRKFLLKRDFWAQPRKTGEPTCYVKHDIRTGGIYAYLQPRGVKIVVNNQVTFFNNFTELDNYLDRLVISNRDENSEFLSILNRRNSSKVLRKIPI